MSDYPLLPEQETLLRRLVEAHNRLLPSRGSFDYFSNTSVSANIAVVLHHGWPEDSPPAYMGDLEALAAGGYVQREARQRGWRFDLTAKAFAYYESLQHPASESAETVAASKTGSTEPMRLDPILILQDLQEGRKWPNKMARLEGKGRFAGLNHDIGSRELFFLYLLFQSSRKHRVAGEVVTVVTEDEASDRLLEWSSIGLLEFTGKDRRYPRSRVRTMWGQFVRQMEKKKKLKGVFEGKLMDKLGNKLYGLRLDPDETQVLISDFSALPRR